MNSGMAALTTAQIASLTGVDSFTVEPLSIADITIDLNDYINDDREIKF